MKVKDEGGEMTSLGSPLLSPCKNISLGTHKKKSLEILDQLCSAGVSVQMLLQLGLPGRSYTSCYRWTVEIVWTDLFFHIDKTVSEVFQSCLVFSGISAHPVTVSLITFQSLVDVSLKALERCFGQVAYYVWVLCSSPVKCEW